MTNSLQITWEKETYPVPVLRLKGRLDADGANEMHNAAVEFLKTEGKADLVVDLAEVNFVASTGMATFLLMSEEFSEVQGTLVFANATPTVRQVISLLNIGQFLEIEDSLETAFGTIGAK